MRVLNIYHCQSKIPPGAVYIGRPNQKLGLVGSVWANPFAITQTQSREQSIERYRRHLDEMLRTGKASQNDLLALDGCDLVCFCHPKACHGDVLIAKIQQLKTSISSPSHSNIINPKP